MGQIVGSFAMSHTLGAPDGIEPQAERVFQGMREVGRRLRDTQPDVVVILTSDHLNNFSLEHPAPLAVATDDSFTPYGDMGIPTDPIKGNSAFARQLQQYATQQQIPLAEVEHVRPDHGVMIPVAISDPQRQLAIVPLYINTVFDPAPSSAECWQLGQMLRRFIEQERPDTERVALLACGGLSHWPGAPEEGQINEAWDRHFMAQLVGDEVPEFEQWSNEEILHKGGSGGLEINAWIALAGAAPALRGEVLFYEAIPEWATGMDGLSLSCV